MKKCALVGVACLLFSSFAGCSGEDGSIGPQGPAGESATPDPFALTLLGAFGSDTEMNALIQDMVLSGVFHPDTSITQINARVTIPELEALAGADVVLVFAGLDFVDPDGVGNLLADYVDSGGAVISAQYCFSGDGFRIGGRFEESPYSPVGHAPPIGEFDSLDTDSIDPDYLELFHGIGTVDIEIPSIANFSDPPLNAWGKVVVRDRLNHKVVSINDAETVMALGVFPPSVWSDGAPGIQKLVGNCLAFMAGAL
jgi:hypothetical protein